MSLPSLTEIRLIIGGLNTVRSGRGSDHGNFRRRHLPLSGEGAERRNRSSVCPSRPARAAARPPFRHRARLDAVRPARRRNGCPRQTSSCSCATMKLAQLHATFDEETGQAEHRLPGRPAGGLRRSLRILTSDRTLARRVLLRLLSNAARREARRSCCEAEPGTCFPTSRESRSRSSTWRACGTSIRVGAQARSIPLRFRANIYIDGGRPLEGARLGRVAQIPSLGDGRSRR